MTVSYQQLFSELFGVEPETEHGYDESVLKGVEQRLGQTLPAPLRSYYRTLGKHPLNQAHNRLLSPDELKIEDGYLVFCHENQQVCVWGYREDASEDADIQVFQGQGDGEWYAEEARLTEFLKILFYLQCVWGGLPWVGDHMDAAQLIAELDADWRLVVDDGGLKIWRSGGCLVSRLDGDDICIGAARDAESSKLLERLGFEEQ